MSNFSRFSKTVLFVILVSVANVVPDAFSAAVKKKSTGEKGPAKMIMPASPTFKEDFQKFCFNNNDAVSDAKFAWQAKSISDMEAKLHLVIKRLEVKKKEYQSWVVRREEFISKMTNSLVEIYSSMDPEAAAAQIAKVDYDTAVSILTKLKPRDASAILNEMEPARASQLVKVIVGAIAVEPEKESK